MVHEEDHHPDPVKLLRRHDEGVLAFDGRIARVRYVINARTGAIVLAVERAALNAGETVLFVPEESEDALAIMLHLHEADHRGADGEACDRFTVYHPPQVAGPGGAPAGRMFVIGKIEAVKLGHEIYDADALNLVNPLVGSEGRLCRLANTDRARLAAAAKGVTGVEVRDPMVVGVDPCGLDVRARFGIVRVEFAEAANTPEEAERAIREILGSGQTPASRRG